MKIKHVEELVGITRKNIRFYEEQGLLNPERADNGYREYHEADIKRLKQIKLLRKLSIPIEEIKKVLSGEKGLDMCLHRHLGELERQKESLEQMQMLSRQLIDGHITLDRLDADTCLEQMERLEKEGTRFMDVNKTDIHKKKTIGALIGAIIMILLMGGMIGIMLWGNAQEPLPVGILAFLIGIPAVIIIGVLAVLIERMKEIKGGEEDEASKY
ncbi:MAG: MerR family transcriptional regulator [Eubacteriales bacterium]|nr:MerR family transcriptional regulator [Eubacteriales bacterium]